MKILVTGSNGFSARHLLRYLKGQDCWDIYCADVKPPRDEPPRPDGALGDPKTDFFQCDLACEDDVVKLIECVMPDRIFHLAGKFTNDFNVDYAANVLSGRNLLESVQRARRPCRILLVGSSAEYGLVPPEDNPVKEDHPLQPISIYGLTKAYQTYLARYYFAVHKMDVVAARPFNLLGRGVSRELFVGHVYEQIDAYRSGRIAKISVGNLESRRDWGRAQDYVQAMWLMLQHETADDYVVATGETHSVREFVDAAFAVVGLPWEKYVKHDSSFNRPTEPVHLVGCSEKIGKTLGWKPAGNFAQLVREMVEAELAAIDSRQ